jgi:transaldolase
VALTLEEGLDEARALLAKLADLGIDMDRVTRQLQDDGVAAFAKSFDGLMSSVAERRNELATA